MKQITQLLAITLFFTMVSPLAHAKKWTTACGVDPGSVPGVEGDLRVSDPSLLTPQAQFVFKTVQMSSGAAKGDAKHNLTAYYLTPQQRENRRFVIVNGHTFYADGRELKSTTNQFNNEMNYVMDAAGNFYLFDESTCPVIRHGSIFDGAPVAGAGNIRIENGEITMIDSDSGHYPSAPVFHQVLQVLKANGAKPQLH